jgi:ParB family chromosome partitioning protein
MLIDIAKIEVGERLRSRLDPQKLRQLADDMERNGQLQEIVVAIDWGTNSRGSTVAEKAVLIAGYRRVEAAKLLGWTQIRCTRQLEGDINPDCKVDLLRIEYSENELRENFTEMERIAFGVKLKERIAETAQKRMLAGKKLDYEYDPESGYKVWNSGESDCDSSTTDPVQNFVQGTEQDYNGGKSAEFVADKVGMSREKFRQGEYVLEHGTEEQHSAIDSGNASINGVYNELKPKPVPQTPTLLPAATFTPPPVSKPTQSPKSPKLPKYENDPYYKKLKAQSAEHDRKAAEFDAMTPDEKIDELQRQLRTERARANTAEIDLAREKELRANEMYHYTATIDMLKNQLAAYQEEEDSAHAN